MYPHKLITIHEFGTTIQDCHFVIMSYSYLDKCQIPPDRLAKNRINLKKKHWLTYFTIIVKPVQTWNGHTVGISTYLYR